jgi:TetR/AcrR family transcriptional regulator, regulator of cefoperazone and chloramphenicol sensitivity
MSKDHQTRSRLIEAAGIVFAQKGYDRATAREICVLAQANPAAVNYHFGGKEPLYVEVLRLAHRRLMNIGYLEAAAQETGAAEEKLGQFLAGLLHSLLDTSPEAWIAKVVMRELAAPTRAVQEVVELQIRPTSFSFRKLMAELMELPADHPAVIRGVLSIFGQCLFLFQNRHVIQLVFPDLDLSEEGIDSVVRHIRQFSLAGLRATAEAAKRSGVS